VESYWACGIATVLSCASLVLLFVSACSDPGIIPRNEEKRSGVKVRPHRKQDFVINGKLFTLKYCCKRIFGGFLLIWDL
jgi:hypothetical protein